MLTIVLLMVLSVSAITSNAPYIQEGDQHFFTFRTCFCKGVIEGQKTKKKLQKESRNQFSSVNPLNLSAQLGPSSTNRAK